MSPQPAPLPPRSASRLPLLLAVALGALGGVGAFTFGYGKGFSYLSSDPRACANCHVMEDYYASWSRSSHHAVAGCVDCHLPHDLPGKLLAKADNGFFHSLVFTLGAPDQIQIKARNRRITQRDCLGCHRDAVDDMLPATPGGELPLCVHCHPGVGHGGRE